MTDFTHFSTFCLTNDYRDMIPDDHSSIEWLVLNGCKNGSTLAMIEINSEVWGGAPPFNLFMEVVLENEHVIDFLNKEEGAIVTYKRSEPDGPKSLN